MWVCETPLCVCGCVLCVCGCVFWCGCVSVSHLLGVGNPMKSVNLIEGSMLLFVACCCSVLQCVGLLLGVGDAMQFVNLVKGSVLRCVTGCCNVLQCVAVFCSV